MFAIKSYICQLREMLNFIREVTFEKYSRHLKE